MSNVLNEEKRQQVLALGRLGWPLRRIQQETGVRRETASAYLRAAGIAVRPPGGWGKRPASKPANEVSPDFGAELAPSATEAEPAAPPTPAQDSTPPESKPANEVSPDPAPGKDTTASVCEPCRDFIELSLSKGRNAKAIYQDLVDDHGFTGRYSSVKRFVRHCRGKQTPEARAVILTPPGEEAQVDYGAGPMVRDPHSGRYRRTRLFVLTLGYSRKCIRLLTFQSSTRIWAELHEQAFRKLGGATKTVVLDNLGEGVLQPDIYDPALNPLYRDVLAHYGAVALPCRVADPDRKGKVERGVGHAKNTPLKGQRFESLEEAQAYLDRWEAHWADTRIHGTVKRQVAAMFAEEKPVLTPLPLEPFRHYQFGERRVNLDGAALKWKPPTTARRRAGSAAALTCSGTAASCACSTLVRVSCCANTYASNAAVTGFPMKTSPRRRREPPRNCWLAAPGSARTSARSPGICTNAAARARFDAFSGSRRWRAGMARLLPMMRVLRHWIPESRPTLIASSASGWNVRRRSRFARSIRSSAN